MGVEDKATRRFGTGLARAAAGAVIFSLPLFMTEEMWRFGMSMDRFRIAGLLAISIPLLVGLSYFAGYEPTESLLEDVRDALIAVLIGFAVAALILATIGVLRAGLAADEIVGVVALQSVPAAIGALISRSQLGDPEQHTETEEKEDRAGYSGELFLMAAGGLVLAFNVAPTNEVQMIAARLSVWHALALVALSIAVLHAFVYAVGFRGQHRLEPGESPRALFVKFSLAGYAVALLVSAYILWSFGRMDGASPWEIITGTVVLSFPTSLGAAVARLVL